MSKPVLINGRSAVHAGSGGVLKTDDICLTGANQQPVTYTNIARSADAAQTSNNVFINYYPACHQKSIFAKSTGDEAGNYKGIKSGTIQGKAEFLSGSPNVYINGIAAVRQGELMVSNNRNTCLAQLQQSTKTVA